MANTTHNGPAPPARKMSRAERRHGAKYRPNEEPTFQIPKGPLIAAIVVLVVAAILGVRTSLQAASSKPFSMEGFEKKKEAGDPEAEPVDADPRDTTEEDYPNGGWLDDPLMAKSMAVKKCDLDRVHHLNMTTKRFAREYEGVKPVIIEGLVGDKWSASSAGRWAQPSLKDSFGLSPIHVSSGAGIVHSGGESLHTVTLSNFLEGLRENDGSGVSATAFTFDLEFIESNKEIKKDYKVPTMFRSFNSHESMRRGNSWSILSVGASGAGLPFHSHGETWLGVVYGAKRWALYPPSTSRPFRAETMADWHPLMGSLEWFKEVEPLIKKTGELPPLQCMQNAGDIMYLPANWGHMTLNIGESIGVGGQALYNAEARLRDGLALLAHMPDDAEVLHSVGVGLAHRGIDALDHEDNPMAGKDGDLDFEARLNLLRAKLPLTAAQILDTASISLKKAMAHRPGYPETHIILAEVLAKAGRVEEAEEVIQRAWKQFSRDELPEEIPDSTLVVIQLNLARFFLQIEEGAKAEKHLKAGPLTLQPEHGDALADLSVSLAMQGQGRMQEAVEILEEAEALGAAGESFNRRRGYVMRMVMQAAQGMATEQVEGEISEDGTGGQE